MIKLLGYFIERIIRTKQTKTKRSEVIARDKSFFAAADTKYIRNNCLFLMVGGKY